MTAREVVELIRKNQGIPWNDRSTRDTFMLGNPDTAVKGIATTMMNTYSMLKRANQAGLNMVITHEDTFWNDRDDTSDLAENPLYKLKTEYALKNGMVVWRDHDHMHAMTPDYTVVGELRSVGVQGGEHATMRPGIWTIPETTLGELAARVKRSSCARALRCVGDPKAEVSRILVGPGYATPRVTPEVDVVIGGEQQEADGAFDNVEYVMDAVSLGMAKGVIMLGHVISEQAGMEDFGNWLRTFLPGIPIRFVPAEEPYWWEAPYSSRRAFMGSSREARRAGRRLPSAAAADSAAAAAASCPGSRAAMPKSRDAAVCASAKDAASPSTRPARISTTASFSTSPTIWLRLAPRAIRMPISLRRRIVL